MFLWINCIINFLFQRRKNISFYKKQERNSWENISFIQKDREDYMVFFLQKILFNLGKQNDFFKEKIEYVDSMLKIMCVCRLQSWSGVRMLSSVSLVPHTASTISWQLMLCTLIRIWRSWWTPLSTCARRTPGSCGPCASAWTQRTGLLIASSSASIWSSCMTSPVWESNCSEPGGRMGGPRTNGRLLHELKSEENNEYWLKLDVIFFFFALILSGNSLVFLHQTFTAAVTSLFTVSTWVLK